jgi:hypothetical protein
VILNRRQFLQAGSAATAFSLAPGILRAGTGSTVSAQFEIHPDQLSHPIAKDFLGLSYETQQLGQPEFFSGRNKDLAEFLRALGPGVLRLGGNTSEYAFWTTEPRKAPSTAGPVGPSTGKHADATSWITPEAIRNLRDFLDMTGWRAMYGLNFGKGTPAKAAEEAAYVEDTLGERLISFQIGNESDLFHSNGLRPKDWDYKDFARQWTQFHDAVKSRVPNARFSGPDTAGTSDWIGGFAKEFGKEIMLLTSHYYALGPPSDPSMTISRLLRPNPRWENSVPLIKQAMAESHLPYRLTETNSCYGGGKEGVSNTFASSLWALDLMFQVLALGGSGINFHGGGYGWYAPVVGTIKNGFVARPEYYALLAMAQLSGGQIIESRLTAEMSNPLFVAYAAKDAKGKLRAVVINKDAKQDLRISIQGGPPGEVSIARLIAPHLSDEQDTTFAGAPVGAAGAWKSRRTEHVKAANGRAECVVPAGSAAMLSWS